MNTHLLQEIYSLATEAKDTHLMFQCLELAMAYDVQLTPVNVAPKVDDNIPEDEVNYVEADIADLIRYILSKGN